MSKKCALRVKMTTWEQPNHAGQGGLREGWEGCPEADGIQSSLGEFCSQGFILDLYLAGGI